MNKLIVGLGNPGEEYKNHFHNLGFMMIDKLSNDFKFNKKFNAEICFLDEETILCKPQTFMNLSGDAVSKIVKEYKIETSNILVLHDDLSVKIRKWRYETEIQKTSHNGIRDICAKIGNDFCRIRIGAGKPKLYEDIASIDWVLMDIPEALRQHYDAVFPEIENKIKVWIQER